MYLSTRFMELHHPPHTKEGPPLQLALLLSNLESIARTTRFKNSQLPEYHSIKITPRL